MKLLAACCVFLASTSLAFEAPTSFTLNGEQQGEFEQQKRIAALPIPLLSRGRFSFSPQGGLKWQTVTPIASLMTIDDQGIRQSQNGDIIWQKDKNSPEALLIGGVFNAVLQQDWQQLAKDFELTRVATEAESSGWQIQLLPRSEVIASYIRQVDIYGQQRAERFVMTEASGDTTHIRLEYQDLSAQ